MDILFLNLVMWLQEDHLNYDTDCYNYVERPQIPISVPFYWKVTEKWSQIMSNPNARISTTAENFGWEPTQIDTQITGGEITSICPH